MRRIAALLVLAGGAAGGGACDRSEPAPALFELLGPESTGVAFVNRLPEDTAFNILNYLYYYNGAGVAAGDVNGDGLPDLYFTANLGPNRLYLNKGNFRFEDVTERAGVADATGWKTGVTMADVNGDGRADLYVSAVDYLTMHGRNVLYVNNGDGTFSDRTRETGLQHTGYSTQALFFDYDGDGDLDMYLLNHSTHTERSGAASAKGLDRLFRNDRGHFVDVSRSAGIRDDLDGYGLGIVASDLNLDGCPDLYVANDFQGDDHLYINRCDGSFAESSARALGHTSRFSMGVDAADFNNDGRPDLMVLDMLPDREDILKTTATTEGFTLFNLRLQAGYHSQYARNTLQLNRGQGRFSDIGFLAGVAATDWSWSPLFADLDNDGLKDLFITNGVYRRPNDLDYIDYVGNRTVQASLAQGITRENLTLVRRMPQVPIANYAFHNNGDLTFTNAAVPWGLAQPGFSNGAAYVDLDNDGALDLVVSNINAPASLYRNRARAMNQRHYLQVTLAGSGANTAGVGAKVAIVHQGRRQLLEQMPTRGFQSAVDPRLHFGLGSSTVIDTLTVIWPDRRFQVLTDVLADRTITLSQQQAAGRYADSRASRQTASPLFRDITTQLAIDFKHEENPFFDFDREPLMPHVLSTEGPALAVGDVDGDGLDDVYVGGAKWQAGRLFLQRRDGSFRSSDQPDFRADSLNEDVNAALFDADGDGDQDLYVVSGGNEFWGREAALRDRLYRNTGGGHLRRDADALPEFYHNGSAVVPGDFNGDGHVDLFVGSRVVSRSYGTAPQSYLLQNDGRGRFTDVTAEKTAELAHVGMVSAATWLDYDHDGRLDLIVVGEWMPVRMFHQEPDGRFVDRTAATGLAGMTGWWNSVTAVDLNGDGRRDLVLGNLGRNSYFRASTIEPARLYGQLMAFYKHGVSYPVAGRDELVQALPSLRDRYRSYAAFGASRLEDILPARALRSADVLETRGFASVVAIDQGSGKFSVVPLPAEAQLAPIYAGIARDFDQDGRTDLVVAGNLYGVPPIQGRYDASYGLLLRGDGAGGFQAVDLEASGLVIDGQVRRMALLRRSNGEWVIVVAKNDDRLQILQPLRF